MYRVNYGTEKNPCWTDVEHIMTGVQHFVYKVKDGINICRRKK